jgi:hypothetical protein
MARTYPGLITATSLASSTKFNDETVLQLQHLLGYTLDGDTLNAITTPSELHNFKHRVAPSTPASGYSALYFDSGVSDRAFIKDDAGLLAQIGTPRFVAEILPTAKRFVLTLSDYAEWNSEVRAIILRVCWRSDYAITVDPVSVYFNGDTTAGNYYHQLNSSQNATAFVTHAANPNIAEASGASAPTNAYTHGTLTIPNVDVACNKAAEWKSITPYGASLQRNGSVTMEWKNTAALTSIELRPSLWSTNGFTALSRVLMYFVK